MKKYLYFLLTFVLMLSLYGCTQGTRVDTGIPDVKMYLAQTVEEKTMDFAGGRQVTAYDAEGRVVSVISYIADSSSMEDRTDMEKYITYHDDGRVYQQMTKHYADGMLTETFVYQYVYDKDSQQVTATVWQKTGENIGTDSVQHILEEENSVIEITGIQPSYGEGYSSVKIRKVSENCANKSIHTEYIAGKAVDTHKWYFSSETHTDIPDFSKGEVIETTVPGIIIHIADTVRKEEDVFDDGSKSIAYFDAEDRWVKLEQFDTEGIMHTAKYNAYDRQGRNYCRMEVNGKLDQAYLQHYNYHPDSLDVTITYGVIWGDNFSTDTVEYTMEKPDSRIHVGGSGFSGTENYFTVNILAICERRTGDFEKWTNYSNGEIVGVDRQEYPPAGTETEHTVSVTYQS